MAAEKGNYYMSSLVNKLQSSSTSTVQKALISLTRATKNLDNVAQFRVEGGIKLLLGFIQTSNRKAIDMSVSALANCALEKESRSEITNQNGLSYLYNILSSLDENSILSRVARAFANLSVDQTTAEEVVELDVISKLIHHLKETNDSQLKQNIIRALRIIGKTDCAKKELVRCNGIQHIVHFLRSDDKDVKSCCLQSLQELSKTGDRHVAEHLQEYCAIEMIIGMTYCEDTKIKENAILTLSNIARNASVRVSVGTIGGIEAFISQIKSRTARNLVLASIDGICLCCREAVNRNKVCFCGGLEVLMGVLRCPEYEEAHDRILGAFVCFYYDERALNWLITNGIVPILLSFLRKIIFSRNPGRVFEKNEHQLLTGSIGSLPASVHGEENSSHVTSLVTKPTVSTPPVKAKIHSTPSKLRIDPPLSLEISQTRALSPPTVLSPNCSPDRYFSNMSPVSQQSPNDGVPSPMVYSPSGSEGEDFDEAGDHEDTDSEEKSSPDVIEDFDVSKSLPNILQPSDGGASISGDLNTRDQENCDVSEIPKADNTVPLLSDTSYDVHMFLPQENLFSADQPSPKKTTTPGNQKAQRVRRSLSRTTPSTSHDAGFSGTSQPSSPYSTELHGPENKILFLLSRFGQMPNPTEALITPHCIQTLLDYLSFSVKPNPKCFRLLNRLTWDINCFEANVLHMFPGAFYRQLKCGFGPRYDLSVCQDDNVERGLHTGSHYGNNALNVHVISDEGQVEKHEEITSSPKGIELSVPVNSAAKGSTSRPSSLLGDTEIHSTYSEATVYSQKISEEVIKDGMKGDFSIPPTVYTNDIGNQLLSVMTSQACTSFGEGQLAHLLLRGSQKRKRACALSLPFLCRPMRLKRRLLLEYNGLLTILTALSEPVEEDDTIRAIEALTYLISNSSITLRRPNKRDLSLRNTSANRGCHSDNTSGDSTEKGDTTKRPVVNNSESKCPTAKATLCAQLGTSSALADDDSRLELPYKRQKLETLEQTVENWKCSYTSQIKTLSCDVMLRLDDGRSILARRSVLSSISVVFSAMLSSAFVEGSQMEVNLKDVDYAVLLLIVHYAYGCAWYFEPDTRGEPLLENKCLPNLPSQFSYDFITDLLVCADRFLINDLKEQCVKVLLWCVSETSVTDLYLFGVRYGAPVLCDFCLKYMFLGKVNLLRLYENVKRLLESEERDNVLADLKRIALECF